MIIASLDWKIPRIRLIIGLIAVMIVGLITGLIYVNITASTSISVPHQQLDAIRRGDIIEAYSYTSNQLRNNMSIDDFTELIKTAPAFEKPNTLEIQTQTIQDTQATIHATIITQQDTHHPVTYTLTNHQSVWKIDDMQFGTQQEAKPIISLLPTDTPIPSPTTGLRIKDIVVNTEADDDGYALEHTDVIASESARIYVTAYIADATRGEELQTTLTCHDEEGELNTIGPLSNAIKQDGNISKGFYFESDTEYWPLGPCNIIVNLDDQESREVTFTIE